MIRLLVLLLFSGLCHAKPFTDADWPPARVPAPEWLSKPDLVVDVKWTRSRSSPSFVYGGVCHLFFADKTEQDMVPAEAQFERCETQSKYQKIPLTSGPAEGVRRIHIYQTDLNSSVERMWLELFDPLTTSFLPGSAADAFYWEAPGNVCVIVTNRNKNAVGHELKHCFDGAWHTKLHSVPVMRDRLK